MSRSMRSPALIAGLSLVTAVAVMAIAAPWITPHEPNFVPEGGARLSPGGQHWFGTDQVGRDVFSRVIYGARTSLSIGVAGGLLAAVIGVPIGVIAGWRRGWLDAMLMRTAEVFLVIPGLLIAAALLVVLGRGVATIIVVLGVAAWPLIARVARAETMRVAQLGFVEASKINGATQLRTLTRHVLPHVVPVVASVVVSVIALSILAESSLAFLGVGIAEPTSSWGLMISTGRRFLAPSPHLILFPATAVFVTVLGFSLISSGLRKALQLENS